MGGNRRTRLWIMPGLALLSSLLLRQAANILLRVDISQMSDESLLQAHYNRAYLLLGLCALLLFVLVGVALRRTCFRRILFQSACLLAGYTCVLFVLALLPWNKFRVWPPTILSIPRIALLPLGMFIYLSQAVEHFSPCRLGFSPISFR